VHGHGDGSLQAGLHRAALGRPLQHPALGLRQGGRQADPHLQGGDAPRRLTAHRFLHPGAGALQRPAVALGHDAHHREQAGGEGRGDQVGGGEPLPLAGVVGGSVGGDHAAGGAVFGGATQAAVVAAGDGGHRYGQVGGRGTA
jgi:hypothetical protein